MLIDCDNKTLLVTRAQEDCSLGRKAETRTRAYNVSCARPLQFSWQLPVVKGFLTHRHTFPRCSCAECFTPWPIYCISYDTAQIYPKKVEICNHVLSDATISLSFHHNFQSAVASECARARAQLRLAELCHHRASAIKRLAARGISTIDCKTL